MTQAYSPDILALNPGLAQAKRESRAKTPSGKGNGHTDNIQDHGEQEFRTPELYRINTSTALAMLGHPTLMARLLEARPDVETALQQVLAALETLPK